MFSRMLMLLAICVFPQTARAQDLGPDDLLCRVVDVGAGQCAVVVIPGGHYIVFDGGNYKDGGATAMDAVEELIPEGETIDLMVISHSDSDHLGAIDDILDAYRATTILHTGDKRSTDTWIAADAAIRNAELNFGAVNLNLETADIEFGKQFTLGDASVTFVAGWHTAPPEFGTLSLSEKRNAISVVIRVEFQGKSILLTGDSVGRHIDDPNSTCIAAERFMLDNMNNVPFRSDVLVAAHHGADNGSSTPFLEAVQPKFVVCSAGHAFQHPRRITAQRFINSGLTASAVFRTDRGDDEGAKEWDHLRIPGHVDPAGDDDVDIIIRENGELQVDYRQSDGELTSLRNLIAGMRLPIDDSGAAAGAALNLSPVNNLGIERMDSVLNQLERRLEQVAPESTPELTRSIDRILREIDELRDDLRKRQQKMDRDSDTNDEEETIEVVIEFLREELDRSRTLHRTQNEKESAIEWDAVFAAIISALITGLAASALGSARRVQRLEAEGMAGPSRKKPPMSK